ncbi:hypothetical protein Plhal304r1_c076g0163901 [Plasmopara halstedii]
MSPAAIFSELEGFSHQFCANSDCLFSEFISIESISLSFFIPYTLSLDDCDAVPCGTSCRVCGSW